jgi:small subunit ribosomal protein S9
MTTYIECIGRRKESTARVRIMPGSGKFIINDREAQEYFPRVGDLEMILKPFMAANQDRNTFDVSVLVKGGGVSGQTGAVTLGLARALARMNAEFVPMLRKYGLLTRDARAKERKKPGLKRARKAPTYTKR